MNPKDFTAAQRLLLDQIQKLNPKGDKGFERFGQAIVNELANVRFYNVKSGPQQGSDIRSDPIHLPRVFIECKRQTKKPPGLDALKAKLVAAANGTRQIDSWIFVSTFEIDASYRDELDELGTSLGVGVCIVDVNKNLSLPSDLLVMAANAPEICDLFLDDEICVKNAVQTIVRHRNFRKSLDCLKKHFQQPTLFYENTCILCKNWLTESQSSVTKAKSRLGGHHSLGTSKELVVRRPHLLESIKNWWDSDDPMLAVLGDEGTGKTWIVLDWTNHLLEEPEDNVIPIFLPATKIEEDIRSTIASALACQTITLDQKFWKRKLLLWEKMKDDAICILLIIDGLNQNIQFRDWGTWFQPLMEYSDEKKYRIVVTCWPLWWTKELGRLQYIEPTLQELEVGGFQDEEIDVLLKRAGIARSSLADPVLNLIKNPRLALLAVEHHKKLRDSGDITAARLVYEDLKQTYCDRHNYSRLSDREFRDIIGSLGKKIKADLKGIITRNQIEEMLKTEFGESGVNINAAVNELSAGAWMKPSEKLSKFQVVPDRIPFAIGIALVAEISEDCDADASAVISQFLDPLKSQTVGAQILFAALTFSCVDSSIAPAGKTAIIDHLLNHQNFSQQEFEELWRLVGVDPTLFLDFIEQSWLAANTQFFLDEILIKTLATSSQYPSVLSELTARITSWMCVIWSHRDELERWHSFSGASNFSEIEFDDNRIGWSWLAPRALSILAYLPNHTLEKPLLAWSLSRSIMHERHHAETMKWLLRWKSLESTNIHSTILNAKKRLDILPTPVTCRASRFLSSISSHSRKSTRMYDESKTNDLQTDFSKSSQNGVVSAITAMLNNNHWPVQHAEPSPVDTLNELFTQTKELSDEEFDQLLKHLEVLLIAMTETSRARIYSQVKTRLENVSTQHDEGKVEAHRLRIAKHIFDLYQANELQQSRLRLVSGLERPSLRPRISDNFRNLYRPTTLEKSNEVLVDNATTQGLACWLEYLNLSWKKNDKSILYAVKDLVIHEELEVRVLSLVLAVESEDLEAIDQFLNSHYSQEFPSRESYEKFAQKSMDESARSLAVLKKSNFTLKALEDRRVRHDAICVIVQENKQNQDVLSEYCKYLRIQFENIVDGKTYSSDTYIFNQLSAIKLVLCFDKARIYEWLIPWIESSPPTPSPGSLFMGESPIIDMMEALAEFDQCVALNMYEKLNTVYENSLFRSNSFKLFPFKCVDSKQRNNEHREQILHGVKSDRELLDLSCYIHENGDINWLHNKIAQLLRSRSPWKIAMGYTLLGYCDESQKSNQLWDNCRHHPPVDGWLREVFRKSLNAYSQNSAGRESYIKFWNTQERTAAVRYLRHISNVCDFRMRLWINKLFLPKQFDACIDGFEYEKRVASLYVLDELNRNAFEKGKRLEQTLFHTQIGPRYMPPWN